MQVPALSIVFIILNMLLGILVPCLLIVFVRRQTKAPLTPVFVGMGTMFLFALVLEQAVHSIVLLSPSGAVITGNPFLMALYGAFMAALFEETGRFLAMRFVLRKKHNTPRTALTYGIGHGGFEMMFLLTVGMINNLIYSIMLNTGNIEVLLAPLDEASRQIMNSSLAALVQTSPYLFLVSLLERIAALASQVAMSVPVWLAAHKSGNARFYFLAFGMHFFLDFVSSLLSGFGVSVMIIEGVIWIVAAAFVWLAVQLWKRYLIQA